MLYTRKGDSGTTKVFNSLPGERISKASCQTEALGAMDELNSFLGLCKVSAAEWAFRIGEDGMLFRDIVHLIQENLFIVQAELAGAPKKIEEFKVKELEMLIDEIEQELPPIKTFFISGGSEQAALFDVSRTLARKAERRVIQAVESGEVTLSEHTFVFLNRLSSILYALARLSNHKVGIVEHAPNYK